MPETIEDQEVKGYAPVPKEDATEEEKQYYGDVDPESSGGEKYSQLKPMAEIIETPETWWDNQTYRTILAVFLTILFTAIIAALVFLLPCVEEEPMLTTMEPLTTLLMDITA